MLEYVNQHAVLIATLIIGMTLGSLITLLLFIFVSGEKSLKRLRDGNQLTLSCGCKIFKNGTSELCPVHSATPVTTKRGKR